ncbi:MAG: class I SAM-dependent methyltransferase [Bacteroidales bacterium]
MNLYPVMAFVRHLLTARSTAGHGVHSPFVFDFLTNVVRGKGDPKISVEVESLRREMRSDRRTVMVTDLGAGSATRKGEERRISEIAGTAAMPPRQAGLLARIAQSEVFRTQGEGLRAKGSELRTQGEELRAKSIQGANKHSSAKTGGLRERTSERVSDDSIILELGTSLGISTLALALAAPERQVVTVEGCPALAEIARQNLLRHGAVNVTVINMEFSKALEMLRTHGTTVSLAFIDGNHRGTALKQYTEIILSMGNEMIIVADDIHLTREMYGAWRSLASSDIAAATMETFRFGILFCHRNLTPGDYRIRH